MASAGCTAHRLQRKRFLNRMVTAPRSEGEALVEEADEMGGAYLATLAKLDRFNKGAKKASKINSHKLEWLEEHKRLEGQAKKLGGDLDESLRSLGVLLAFDVDDMDGPPPATEAAALPAADAAAVSGSDQRHSPQLQQQQQLQQRHQSGAAALREESAAAVERRGLVAEVQQRLRDLKAAQAQLKALHTGLLQEQQQQRERALPPQGPPEKEKKKKRVVRFGGDVGGDGEDSGGGRGGGGSGGDEDEDEDEDEGLTEHDVRSFGSNVAHFLLETRRWNEGCGERLDAAEDGLAEALAAARRAVARVIAGDSAYGVLGGDGGSGSGPDGGGGTCGGGGGEGLTEGGAAAGEMEAVADAEVRKMLALLGELDMAPTGGGSVGAAGERAVVDAAQDLWAGQDENADPVAVPVGESGGGPMKRRGCGMSPAAGGAEGGGSSVTERGSSVTEGGEPRSGEPELEVLLARAEVADRVRLMVRRRYEAGRAADETCAVACQAAVSGSAAVAAAVAAAAAPARAAAVAAAAAAATAAAAAAAAEGRGGAATEAAVLAARTAAAAAATAEAEASAAEASAEATAVAACAAPEGRGGWGRRSHEAFEATYRPLALGHGRSRERLLDRLALTLGDGGGGGGGYGDDPALAACLGARGGGDRLRAEVERHAAWCDAVALRKTRRSEEAERYPAPPP